MDTSYLLKTALPVANDSSTRLSNATTTFLDAMTANASDVTKRRMTSQSPTKLSEVTMSLMVYVIPVIFCFGIFGNLVSLVVFLSEKMRRVSTNVYLAALSASNTVFLLAVAVSWTDLVGLKLMHHNVLCQATVYLTYCSGFLSAWLVVCITVENFVINFFLHKAAKHCTVSRALGVVLLLCVTSFFLHGFALWTSGVSSFNISETVSTQYCHTYDRYLSTVELFTFIDVTVTLVVPTVIILALLIPTCIKDIWRTSRRGDASVRAVLSRKERALLRVKRLLIVISVSFVGLSAPSHLNKLRHLFTAQTARKEPGPTEMFLVFIFQVFYHLSFSMNFVYFLILGKNFRGRFCHMFVAVSKLVGVSRG